MSHSETVRVERSVSFSIIINLLVWSYYGLTLGIDHHYQVVDHLHFHCYLVKLQVQFHLYKPTGNILLGDICDQILENKPCCHIIASYCFFVYLRPSRLYYCNWFKKWLKLGLDGIKNLLSQNIVILL